MQIALVATGPDGHWVLRQDVDLQCGPASPATQDFSTAKRAYFVSGGAGLSGYVTELTGGFVLADLGIAHNPREDDVAYIASCLTILKSDPRAIFTAASKAQAIADWMHAQQCGGLSELVEANA